jgi:hypothetical protein
MKRPIALIALLFVLAIACTHEMPLIPTDPAIGGTGGSGGTGGTGSSGSAPTIYFQEDVLPIFKNNCSTSGCHDVTTHQKDIILNSYSQIMKGIEPLKLSNSKFYTIMADTASFINKHNARPVVSATQVDIVKKWILDSAKNTTRGACDTSKFTYSLAIKPIIDSNCVKCHNGTGVNAPASLNYTIYDGLKQVASSGRLLGAITHSPGYFPMPKNNPQLSDCKITQIRKWIEAGAPNN